MIFRQLLQINSALLAILLTNPLYSEKRLFYPLPDIIELLTECEYSKELLKKKLFYLVFFTCPQNTPFNPYFDILTGVQDKVIYNKKALYPLFFKYFFYTKNECLFAFRPRGTKF